MSERFCFVSSSVFLTNIFLGPSSICWLTGELRLDGETKVQTPTSVLLETTLIVTWSSAVFFNGRGAGSIGPDVSLLRSQISFGESKEEGCINKRILSFSSTRRWDAEVGRGGTKTSDLRRSFWFHFSLEKEEGQITQRLADAGQQTQRGRICKTKLSLQTQKRKNLFFLVNYLNLIGWDACVLLFAVSKALCLLT